MAEFSSALRYGRLIFAGVLLLGTLATAEEAANTSATAPQEKSFMPDMMDGFAHFQHYQLTDPVTHEPLMSRYIEMIVVNGEIDPPYTDGDDRIQDLSQDFNSQRERDYMNENPGLVQALVTVIVAKGVPDDTTVQLWEKVMMRVYNNDDKDKATHYIDTEPWESQPGFWTITPNEAPVGEWKKIHKN
ncbi:MAG: hypothetical protein H6678_14520 [Candidatus Delongbacteria bacterium]|nr:hypothetical protein [Candidatus Cloacimonadota bacterium]MCB9475011.1 hypothetical protein [Candidatus Delongbacteria bacterium]